MCSSLFYVVPLGEYHREEGQDHHLDQPMGINDKGGVLEFNRKYPFHMSSYVDQW